MKFDGYVVTWLLCLVIDDVTKGRISPHRLAKWAVRGIDRHQPTWSA